MSLQALDQPARVPAAPQPAKRERISPKLVQAIDLLLSGECKLQKDAAARVGFDPAYLSRALAKGHVRVFYERRARETIAQGTMRATARLLSLIDASSEHVSLDATKHTLAIANIRPPDQGHGVNVNVGVSVGYVIDLTPSAHTPQAPNMVQVIENVESEEQ